MDNLLGTKSVDWSLINIWCCGKFLSSVDLSTHAELCHGMAESYHEETKCRTEGPKCTTRIGRKSIQISPEEQVEIVSPVKETKYWSKDRRRNYSKVLTSNVDLKDTFVDTNYAKGGTRMETICDDMKNMSNEDFYLKKKELAQQKIIPQLRGLPFTAIKPPPKVIKNVQIKKQLYRPKLKKPEIYSCPQCYYQSKRKHNLRIHQMAMHSGVWHACDECDYKTRRVVSLKMHKESIHEGITYSCAQCNFKAKQKTYLKRHIESVHEGVAYSCDQCDYKAKMKKYLKLHKESIHDAITYSCNQCNYKAKQKGYLKIHKESVHEGVSYSCDQCYYKTNWKRNLIMHKESVHE